MGVNLVNIEKASITFGTRILLDEVSLGISAGDVIGVVGRNGDGKTTLLKLFAGLLSPDSGQVTINKHANIGLLSQAESLSGQITVRQAIVGDLPDHQWLSDPRKRSIVEHLLANISLDQQVDSLSGGERRRVGLVSLLINDHDLLILDEPTNHLDVVAIRWLSEHLRELQRLSSPVAILAVSHDRWFLDAICTNIWEVHDATVDAYEGGYAAYVLARAERGRQAAVHQAKRQNLLRKELAWLRRGAPARTSKPKFRIEAANELIADVAPPRDKLALERFAVSRLGKDVLDLAMVSYELPNGAALFSQVDWSIGPGDRIGIIGINGCGKSTLFNLLAGKLSPTSGKIKVGQTVQLGYLSQHVGELDDSETVLESVSRLKQRTKLATGKESSASDLLNEFGFSGSKLVTRIGQLSGGERRRLQFLRLLIGQPNVLFLDEPTNDLDVDTLTVVEDYLDSWPGTLLVASHDRYFLERVCDVTYALLGDGSCVLLPGGIDQYLAMVTPSGSPAVQATDQELAATPNVTASPNTAPSQSAASRQAKKDLARIENQLAKLDAQIDRLHQQMATHSDDYLKLGELNEQLNQLTEKYEQLEQEWILAAENL